MPFFGENQDFLSTVGFCQLFQCSTLAIRREIYDISISVKNRDDITTLRAKILQYYDTMSVYSGAPSVRFERKLWKKIFFFYLGSTFYI